MWRYHFGIAFWDAQSRFVSRLLDRPEKGRFRHGLLNQAFMVFTKPDDVLV